MSSVVNNNPYRVGNFTSSQIYNLLAVGKDRVSFGAPALTYIDETNISREVGRSVSNDASSKEMAWGSMLEGYVYDKYLWTEYSPVFTETTIHPDIDFWAGSPDVVSNSVSRKVGDIKCPFTLKSFVHFARCKDIAEVRELHKDGEKYYWQLVSNAAILGCDLAELIIFCPHKTELDVIRERCLDNDEWSQLYYKSDGELPYLIEGVSIYGSLVRFEFEVPKDDIERLTDAVLRAGKLLVPRTKYSEITI